MLIQSKYGSPGGFHMFRRIINHFLNVEEDKPTKIEKEWKDSEGHIRLSVTFSMRDGSKTQLVIKMPAERKETFQTSIIEHMTNESNRWWCYNEGAHPSSCTMIHIPDVLVLTVEEVPFLIKWKGKNPENIWDEHGKRMQF